MVLPANTPALDLRVVVEDGAICQFSYSIDGTGYETIGAPFQAREGRWIGAKVGLFAVRPPGRETGGYADFDHLRIEHIDAR